jgi:Flp pilus assembly protein CpaB
VLAASAVWLVGSPLLPHDADAGDPVVVVARDLPIGSTLSAADVRLERRASGQRPTSALDRADGAVGRVAAGPLVEGEILTSARFQGPSQLTGLGAARVAVSVPLVEAGLLTALRPADVVQVLAASTGQTVAADAPVLSVHRPSEGVLGQGEGAGHVVLALTGEEARAVAAAITAQTGPAGFVLALQGR